MMTFLLLGLLFGMSAGISPGPLFALIISETLSRNTRAGIQIAVAPLISDVPIILGSFFLLSQMADISGFLFAVTVAGAFYLIFLGIKSINTRAIGNSGVTLKKYGSLARGVLVNILNPHPYLFWLTIGAPTILRARDLSPWAVAAFLGGFYFSLLCSKCALAVMTGTSKKFISTKILVRLNQIMGAVLILLALILLSGLFKGTLVNL